MFETWITLQKFSKLIFRNQTRCWFQEGRKHPVSQQKLPLFGKARLRAIFSSTAAGTASATGSLVLRAAPWSVAARKQNRMLALRLEMRWERLVREEELF